MLFQERLIASRENQLERRGRLMSAVELHAHRSGEDEHSHGRELSPVPGLSRECSGVEAAQFQNCPPSEGSAPGRAVGPSSRYVRFSAIPTEGTLVRSIDLDLTVACNLRCTYCFKEKWHEHMEDRVAFDAIVWLLHASGPVESVSVNLMGGEPLLRLKLIKQLVPFAKRRAFQRGKRIHFGITTNGTLVTDEVVAFWREWGLGFHTSIDGSPDIQDRNRPTVGGRSSSRLVEQSVPKILSYRPRCTARCTVMPETASSVFESYKYFRKLGYTDIAFVPGNQTGWSDHDVQTLERAFWEVGRAIVGEMRDGQFVNVKGIDEYVEGIRSGRWPCSCGAGRGLVLIDIRGDIWPCHRWNKASQKTWRIGSIYEEFDELVRRQLTVESQTDLLEQDCETCVANLCCSGGCPAENLEETGSIYRRHTKGCELTRVFARVGKYVHNTLLAEKNPVYLEAYYSKSED